MLDLRPWILRIEGRPAPKPRMTRRDKWFPSEPVLRYWAWADLVRPMARSLFKGGPLPMAVIIKVTFYLPIPKSCSRPERLRRLDTPHVIKPDLKNLIAGLEDILKGTAWNDDSQIVGYDQCRKVWGHTDGLTVLKVRPCHGLNDVMTTAVEGYPQGYPQEEGELSTGEPPI